ncbi:hypothetical protein [Bradyrhizobium sp. 613_E4_N2_2]|uniref:hypothetical protein n=1 Tax=Bradyrhizobium sp. 613_E4_N2_2 TaxID=3240371 RepID=UPI003F887B3A
MIAWIKSYGALLKRSLVAIFGLGMFAFGYHVRDLRADRDTAVVTANQATAVVVQQEAHAEQTQANAAAGAQDAQDLHDQTADRKTDFQIIYRDVVKYVEAKPAPAVCDLDAVGLRKWNAANAGKPDTARQPDATR